ncbi:hypothetical protein C5167_040813 [Papaver somniferum]|uniref:CobW/HypB/UreG nucleotide-binding domain-containing protein n=1 Tax=Papaver somniferum TaxID=3469 RepID=A0A4Y7IJH6_PAPSO|nr:hypothetical protein C5167_040813 [Papaver somniferum]
MIARTYVHNFLGQWVESFAGLANPSPIIQTFYAVDHVFNNVKMDSVVTLVDVVAFQLDEEDDG